MDGTLSFGDWLRRRRKALDLTQVEVAHSAGCVVGTIKSIEADARRPSKQLAARLADCLELTQDDHALFVKAARGLLSAERLPGAPARARLLPAVAALPAGKPRRGNLPTRLSPLIGRERELRLSRAAPPRRGAARTLTGPGGAARPAWRSS